MRTTTGWLDRVVRLEADFAEWALRAAEAWDWKAGALRARKAALWVGGSVLVRVVVALGTEPALAARSGSGGSCASTGEGAWVTIAGGRAVGGPLMLHSVDSTPWRVVVAGVTFFGGATAVGGSAVAVAAAAAAAVAASSPCWATGGALWAGAAEESDGGAPAARARLAGRELAAESGMVLIAGFAAARQACMVASHTGRVLSTTAAVKGGMWVGVPAYMHPGLGTLCPTAASENFGALPTGRF